MIDRRADLQTVELLHDVIRTTQPPSFEPRDVRTWTVSGRPLSAAERERVLRSTPPDWDALDAWMEVERVLNDSRAVELVEQLRELGLPDADAAADRLDAARRGESPE